MVGGEQPDEPPAGRFSAIDLGPELLEHLRGAGRQSGLSGAGGLAIRDAGIGDTPEAVADGHRIVIPNTRSALSGKLLSGG